MRNLSLTVRFFLILVSILPSKGQQTNDKSESYRQRGQAIIRRIAAASGSSHIRPSLIVGESPGIAHFDLRNRTITADPRLFDLADRKSPSPDVALAYVLGHEYAHYVRGHDFDYNYQHAFGEILEKDNLSDDITTMLAVSRQKEFEADYYGLYFCYLAGYRFTLKDLTSFMENMKREFSEGYDYASTHPRWASRKLVVEATLREFERLSAAHLAGVYLLNNEKYLEASSLFDWISSTVPLPEVQWNELVARLFIVQDALHKVLLDKEALLAAVNVKSRFRGAEVRSFTNVDADVQLDKCESILQSLRASSYTPPLIGYLDSTMTFARSVLKCTACSATNYCDNHNRLLPRAVAVDLNTNNHPGDITPDVIDAKLIPVRRKLSTLKQYVNSDTIDLGDYDLEIRTSTDKTRSSSIVSVCAGYDCNSITILAEDCQSCTLRFQLVFDRQMIIQTDGQKIFISLADND